MNNTENNVSRIILMSPSIARALSTKRIKRYITITAKIIFITKGDITKELKGAKITGHKILDDGEENSLALTP